MRLVIGAVGRMRSGPERDLLDRYVGRVKAVSRTLGCSGPDMVEIEESRARSAAERKHQEASTLMARLGHDGRTIVFDETGRTFTSDAFASLIENGRRDNSPAMTFLVGGPDGFDPRVPAEAHAVLAFGAATLPHQLVRVLIAEQIYRAVMILTRHPYHRA